MEYIPPYITGNFVSFEENFESEVDGRYRTHFAQSPYRYHFLHFLDKGNLGFK
jgi:hypothetical protein